MKCFSVSGHVERPGNYEVPLGIPFQELLELAGGVRGGCRLKAVIPGGSSVPVVRGERMLETDMDYEAISAAGSMLGSGAVVVMDEQSCMVRVLRRISRFYYAESCGQCTPCREGAGWLYRMLDRIVQGRALLADLERLDDVAAKIEGRTICALGDAAAWPVRSFLREFHDEFTYMIEHDGRSMWSACRRRPETVSTSMERDAAARKVADRGGRLEPERGSGQHANRGDGRARHLCTAFLLPLQVVGGGELPHVPGGGGARAENPAGLRHTGHRGDVRAHPLQGGPGSAARGDGVSAHQPPAGLSHLRSRRRV